MNDPAGEQPTELTDMATLLGEEPSPVVADRYVLRRVLGVGGVAVVHEATDTRLDRQVAVKLLRDSAGDETERARFVSEARLLGRLGHPGLVRVLDAGIDGHRPFLVLELVPGRTLADALTEGLPHERVAQIGADVAEALAHVHAAGIVHRDVKPGNVLLSEDGSVKLADFGIARLVDDTHHHTRTGMLVGTVAYLAPEQVTGDLVTTAVDVYAWGLVLLEALTGQRAYPGNSVESALARVHRSVDVPATLPSCWRSLLSAMTALDPASRPRAAEVADRLRALRDGVPTVPAATSTTSPRPRLVLAGVAGAFALLVGVAAAPAISGLPGGRATGAASAHRTAPSAASDAPARVSTPAEAAPTPVAAAVEKAPAPTQHQAPSPKATKHRDGGQHRGHRPHPPKHGSKHKHGPKHGPKHKHKHGPKHHGHPH